MRRIAFLIGACLALAGCGGSGSSESSETSGGSQGAAQRTITVSETEFSLTPNVVDIGQPGTVAFRVRNIGQIAHALEIEGQGVHDETEAIQPGQSATLTIRLSKAGSYEMYCPIDSHESKGMKGTVKVAGTSGAGGMQTGGGTTTDDDTTSTEGTTTDDKGGSGY
jgi:uncharacterized cupredoxin-like copper-binding protein